MTATYKGRAIHTLTRDELIEALEWAIRELQTEREWTQRAREMDRVFAEIRLARSRRTV